MKLIGLLITITLILLLFISYLNLNKARTENAMEKFQQVETNQEISNYDNPQDYSDEKVENINEKTLERQNIYD